ncbi:Cytochrome P450 [Halobacillus karajensis]|uniref:cytochrome P450 family protein n=1 Tax=Halobacillus karajensis TaxID=195088 RepID=UPI0008A7EA2E|nr:cytochrome P450 [Halobacillus karajensis]SEI02164.1 Cytochrome P450 [Halobacillus karajensis]
MKNSEQVVPNEVLGLLSGESVENPFPLLAKLRAIGSVVPIPNPLGERDRQAWMVTQMDVAMQVIKDHARFTVDPSSIDGRNIRGNFVSHDDSSAPSTFFTGKSMLFVDEPDHRRLRKLVSKAFTPRYVESLRPRVQEIADELLDQVQEQGKMDIVKDYAYPLPINVISEMLGIPQSDRKQLQVWSGAIAQGIGWGRQEPEVAKHLRDFGEYTAKLVDDKRHNPADDLISQLIAVGEDEDQLTEEELISMITLLIFAGHETTSNLIATGTFMLLDHPKQLKKLKADIGLVPSAVEELLRYNGPATSVGPRFATEDVELAGQQIKKGDMLLVLVKSAIRDEGKFDQSEDLDITRKINRHLAFGHGIHMCLGAPLARMEGEIAFSTLLRRMPDLQLGIPKEDVSWQFTLSTQGLDSLPVKF